MKLDDFIEKIQPRETRIRLDGDGFTLADLFFDNGIDLSICYRNEKEPVGLAIFNDDVLLFDGIVNDLKDIFEEK